MIRFSAIFIFASVLLTSISVYGQLADKKKDLARIRTEISEVSGNIERLEKEQSALLAEMADIEKLYGSTVATLKTLNSQIALKQKKIESLRTESKQLKVELNRQIQGLGSQIRAAYALGRKEKLKLLLNQQEPALSSRMMVYYDYFNNERLDKLEHIKNSLTRIKELEQEERNESVQLELQLTQVRNEQALLAQTRDRRKELMARLDKEYSSSKLKLGRLREGEQRLARLIQQLKQAESKQSSVSQRSAINFVKSQGDLRWPVNGRIIKKFGSPRLESRWDGVLIAADEGTEIKAVSKGKVVFSDWFRGYGLLTIIDHGNDFMTLYAFNQSLYKTVGDQVAEGDVIATVGRSGGRSKASLYFGIRKKGQPVDPVRWCRKLPQGRAG
ncbi:MAG: murein hydrolase activator EnvC family protein [Gammaproteobacteria bacterium]